MKPRERRATGQNDLFKAKLDQVIDMSHPRVLLAHRIDWGFLEGKFGAFYSHGPGSPPLPTRLMAGLHILKYSENLSDERLCEVWAENPYFQYFCGEEFFQHKLVFDRSSLTRWRQRMGEDRLNALIQESLAVAAKTQALKPSELSAVVVDTTMQPKNVAHPTDAKLLNRACKRLVRLAKKHGVPLRQSYARVGKRALIKQQRYAHAKQFMRANKCLRKLKTYLGGVTRDIGRKIEGDKARCEWLYGRGGVRDGVHDLHRDLSKFVDPSIPHKEVTLLAGDGGIGKSLMVTTLRRRSIWARMDGDRDTFLYRCFRKLRRR